VGPLKVIEAPATFAVNVGDHMLFAAGTDDFVDPTLAPSSDRVRSLIGGHDYDLGLVPRARMVRARDGAPHGALRTFNGNLSHENGLVESFKSGRMLGWQGESQYLAVIRAQTSHEVIAVATESVRFEWIDGGARRKYTADLELIPEKGPTRLIEVKRDERDLDDPALCRSLAIVAEICRCCALQFDIVFGRDIFASDVHRRQASKFASQAKVVPTGEDIRALLAHAAETGGTSTYQRLSRALRPDCERMGNALVRSMTVRRLVEIDLTTRVRSDTPVVLHPANARS